MRAWLSIQANSKPEYIDPGEYVADYTNVRVQKIHLFYINTYSNALENE